ncbi:MAG TPA: DUF2231 domain-containing protein [Terriglobales bacterium]|jgi:uncharacterized membrane protein|nr:DUF2231 domain-containing protein [Terriglobales bacterium]
MNPWDPRTVLLAKHAQHVVLIHFPIALFIVGVALDFVASVARRKDVAAAAYYNLCLAALAAVPAALTGVLAWQLELEGRRLKGILLLHLLLGCASTLLILTTWWMHRKGRPGRVERLPRFRWAVEVLGVVLVGLTGHLGGFLSGVNHP